MGVMSERFVVKVFLRVLFDVSSSFSAFEAFELEF
jgi:hypothetical protein